MLDMSMCNRGKNAENTTIILRTLKAILKSTLK